MLEDDIVDKNNDLHKAGSEVLHLQDELRKALGSSHVSPRSMHTPDSAQLFDLLHRLHDLVGPNFGFVDPDLRDSLCDALARVLPDALPENYRLKLMHLISPGDYVMNHADYISNVLVRGRISAYLKRHIQEKAIFDSSWGIHERGTGRTPGRSGTLTDRPPTPDKNRVSDLSTPIANLLIDLRTMHDAM
jgi:hypothetical protein